MSVARRKSGGVVFFDVASVLGGPLSATGGTVNPQLATTLANLRKQGVRAGIISEGNGGTSAELADRLRQQALDTLFETNLLVTVDESRSKARTTLFEYAASVAKLSPSDCAYVSVNRRDLCFALDVGFRIARDVGGLENALQQLVSPPDISNLAALTDDVRQSSLDGDPGPDDPTDFQQLMERFGLAHKRMPPLYDRQLYTPLQAKLVELGPSGFNQILVRDPGRHRAAALLLDLVHAVLQNGELYNDRQTDAFEEVVSDLYDGFLSAQDRRGIKSPQNAVIPPLVKWGQPNLGPYTWPADATATFGAGCAVVSLPPANARRGLAAWAALGHETAGHDILHADVGLTAELSDAVQQQLIKHGLGYGLAEYWSTRIDETASDVMGILNMGPAAGIGMIAFFRGIRAAFGAAPKLSGVGPTSDPHPADILRGFLAAATVRRLEFQGAEAWSNVISRETEADLTTIELGGQVVPTDAARDSAELVADVIALGKMATLNHHALAEIQTWRGIDESIIAALRPALASTIPVPTQYEGGVFAAHVVAAAVLAALAKDASAPLLFGRMIAVLKLMHDRNPSWGPLYVAHPSTISREWAYLAQPPAV